MTVDTQTSELDAAFRGQLIRPGDADYDETRQIWNAIIDRWPALIAVAGEDRGRH
jgi:hypothetical protein